VRIFSTDEALEIRMDELKENFIELSKKYLK